jgi:prolyl oligopeptidase
MSDLNDPYLWLEDVTGERALDWVRERNDESRAELAASDRFERMRSELLEVLDSDERIPYPRLRQGLYYNFWQDTAHPRGVWRRTTAEGYRAAEPEWEVLLDLDALAEREEENWVWAGAAVLQPGCERALVQLSRGGADASVVREFDLGTREFVEDGFRLPEAKTRVDWIDFDTIYVGTDFGEGSLTTSGYPRLMKQWRRGTPLSAAGTVFEGKPGDVSVFASHDSTVGFERAVIGRSPDFFTSEVYLRPDASSPDLVRIDVPDDAGLDLHREWLLVTTRTPWEVGGRTYPGGALLVTTLEAFLAGGRDLTMLFEPDEHTSLAGHAWTMNHLIVETLSDVKTRIDVLTPGPDGWSRAPLPGVPEVGAAQIVSTDPDHDDAYVLHASGYTQPATLGLGRLGTGRPGSDHAGSPPEFVRHAPGFFDTDGVTVEQLFATSDDGTRVPYFVIGRRGPEPAPTMLHGYGGFEVALTPEYSGVVGRGWIARGGVYVVANIRGGGEYGPRWHLAAMREKRPRAYEDFAAVARDLVARGITTARQLGIEGGSNGGLLTGVMLTTYPELFGAVVSQVPLLDLRRYHLLLAGASWMAEWGDPDDPADWEYLRTFSPYHLLRADRTYPPALLMTSTRDDRVHPGHARKMVALMREYDLDVRYYENIEGGHGGASNNDQRATKWALIFEFLHRTLDR